MDLTNHIFVGLVIVYVDVLVLSLAQDDCSPDPCLYGKCRAYQDTFRCDCLIGATGYNCEHVADLCSYRPCIHGSCENNIGYRTFNYTCKCDEGYTGDKCDIVIDHCDPNPCIHGDCVQTAIGFNCRCRDGYTGRYCSTGPFTLSPTSNSATTAAANPTNTSVGSISNASATTTESPSSPTAGTTMTSVLSTLTSTSSTKAGKVTATTSTTFIDVSYTTAEVDPCLMNPCVFGTCNKTSATTYTCSCILGYIGVNCDTPELDPCLMNPCVFGACNKTGATTYTCSCIQGYIGENCDTHDGLPVVQGLPIEFISISRDGSLSLSCNIVGALNYSWTKVGDCGNTILTTDETLTLDHITLADGGTYVCTASNQRGTVQKVYNALVKFYEKCDFEDRIGDDYRTVSCGIWEDDPTSDFSWRYGLGPTLTDETGPNNDHTTGSGSYIFTESSSPQSEGDIASLLSTVFPGTVDVCITFYYNMYGSGMGTLDVILEDVCTRQIQAVFSISGDQGQNWHEARISIPASDVPNDFRLRIVGIIGNSYLSDIAIDDVTVMSGNCGDLSCNFERDICGWTQSWEDDFDWQRHNSTTPSPNTGPNGDHTDSNGAGYYLYIESSYRQDGDHADLISPFLQPEQEYCLTIYTNLYGETINDITIMTQALSASSPTVLEVFNQKTTTPEWTEHKIDIPPQAEVFHVVIGGATSNSSAGDAAIDDLSLTLGTCADTIVNPRLSD